MTNKKRIMNKFGPILAALTVTVAVFISGCSGAGSPDADTNAALDSVNPAVSQVNYVEGSNEAGNEAGGEHGSGNSIEGPGEHGSISEGGSEHGGEHSSASHGEHGSFGEGAVVVSRSPHERDSGGAGEGEESGTEYALDQTYDVTRNGARLVLVYDAQNNVFIGIEMINRTGERI